MAKRKYELPDFLADICSRDHYVRWLQRKAVAHVRRDRRRGNPDARISEYKEAIHNAVLNGGDQDAYTGERLDWSLISTYDNKESQKRGRAYKKEFALLPTVDHVGDGTGYPDFVICSWRTNDAKSDLDLAEFLALGRRHRSCGYTPAAVIHQTTGAETVRHIPEPPRGFGSSP